MNSLIRSRQAWRTACSTNALIALLVGSSLPAAESTAGWQPDPKALEALAATRVTWRHDEKGIPKYELPDPLARPDGSRVTTAKEWEQKQRPQTLELFRQLV